MEKNKKMEIYKNLILDVPGVKTAKFEKSIAYLKSCPGLSSMKDSLLLSSFNFFKIIFAKSKLDE